MRTSVLTAIVPRFVTLSFPEALLTGMPQALGLASNLNIGHERCLILTMIDLRPQFNQALEGSGKGTRRSYWQEQVVAKPTCTVAIEEKVQAA